MNLKFILPFIIYSFSFFLGFAQSKIITDSLLLEVKNGIKDSVFMEKIKQIAINHPNPKDGLKYAFRFYQLADSLKLQVKVAEAYEEIALKHRLLGNQAASLEASLNALKTYKKLGLFFNQGGIYDQLGINYVINGQYEKGIGYLKKAVVAFKNSANNRDHALTLLNLGEAYRLAGRYDSALINFKKSIMLNKFVNDDIVEGYSLGNMGLTYKAIDKRDSAIFLLESSIEIVKSLGDIPSLVVYQSELAAIYNSKGNKDYSLQLLKEAYALASKESLKEQIRDIGKMLAEFYERENVIDSALYYQKVYQTYQDSLSSRENVKKLAELEVSNELQEKQSLIQSLSQSLKSRTFLTIILGLGLVLIAFLVIYLIRVGNKRKKHSKLLAIENQQIAKSETEKEVLLKELNHRVKNHLQMIASLLNLQEHELAGHPAEEAIKSGKLRVEALSLMHQKLYQQDLHTEIELADFIKELVLNLFYSHGAKFEPSLTLDSGLIQVDKAISLALITNELVTNALKYAYENVADPQLDVVVKRGSGILKLEISDNGTATADIDLSGDDSFGIQLVHALTKQLKGNSELEVANGVRWKIKIPVK